MCLVLFLFARARIKAGFTARMSGVGARLAVYVLVAVWWSITTISLDSVYKSVATET